MDCSVFLNNLTTKPWLLFFFFFKGGPLTHEEETMTFVLFHVSYYFIFFSFSKMWPSHSGSVWRGLGEGRREGRGVSGSTPSCRAKLLMWTGSRAFDIFIQLPRCP